MAEDTELSDRELETRLAFWRGIVRQMGEAVQAWTRLGKPAEAQFSAAEGHRALIRIAALVTEQQRRTHAGARRAS